MALVVRSLFPLRACRQHNAARALCRAVSASNSSRSVAGWLVDWLIPSYCCWLFPAVRVVIDYYPVSGSITGWCVAS